MADGEGAYRICAYRNPTYFVRKAIGIIVPSCPASRGKHSLLILIDHKQKHSVFVDRPSSHRQQRQTASQNRHCCTHISREQMKKCPAEGFGFDLSYHPT